MTMSLLPAGERPVRGIENGHGLTVQGGDGPAGMARAASIRRTMRSCGNSRDIRVRSARVDRDNAPPPLLDRRGRVPSATAAESLSPIERRKQQGGTQPSAGRKRPGADAPRVPGCPGAPAGRNHARRALEQPRDHRTSPSAKIMLAVGREHSAIYMLGPASIIRIGIARNQPQARRQAAARPRCRAPIMAPPQARSRACPARKRYCFSRRDDLLLCQRAGHVSTNLLNT